MIVTTASTMKLGYTIVYVPDVQERLTARIAELDIEVHEDEFEYWRKYDRTARAKK